MKIKFKISSKGVFSEISLANESIVENIVEKFNKDLKEKPLGCIKNNRYASLTDWVAEGDEIELIYSWSREGNLIYQRTLSLVYMKAVHDIFTKEKGKTTDVEITNPLNKGLYTEIKGTPKIDKVYLIAIKKRMRDIIKEDLKIVPNQSSSEKNRVVYTLGDFSAKFAGIMAPSTGYLNDFDIYEYKKGIILNYPQEKNSQLTLKKENQKQMYSAFGEIAKWQKFLGINYAKDLSCQIEKGQMRDIIQLSEALHSNDIVKIATTIVEEKKRIILIAGPSSSGKTTFAKRLCVQLMVNGRKPLYLGTDDYFLDRKYTPVDEFGNKNFEDIEALDLELFNNQMNSLLKGEEVDIPEFDFITGVKKYGHRITKIGKNQPIVIEGIHGLNQQLTGHISDKEKFKIYISPLSQINIDKHNRIPTTDARILRRMARDYLYRGKSATETIAQWHLVRAGENKNVFPYIGEADVFFNSSHIYEIPVLKKIVEPLLQTVRSEDREFAHAENLLKMLSNFESYNKTHIIPNNSILREFIGESVFK